MSTEVTARDTVTGETETVTIPDNDYVLICGADRYLDSSQSYANGTAVLTVKTHKPALVSSHVETQP